jgi:hypothetical protein
MNQGNGGQYARGLNLLQIAGFEHETAGVHLAIDFMVAANKPDAFYFRADFQRDR